MYVEFRWRGVSTRGEGERREKRGGRRGEGERREKRGRRKEGEEGKVDEEEEEGGCFKKDKS
jgi:hypothetical protein